MRIRTLHGVLMLAAFVGIWWLSGKPAVNVSIGDDPPRVEVQPFANSLPFNSQTMSLAELLETERKLAVEEFLKPKRTLPLSAEEIIELQRQWAEQGVNVVPNETAVKAALMDFSHDPPRAVDQLTPAPVVELVAPFVKPLAVALRGPRDAMVGDMIDLTTELTGTPSDFEWTVEPQTDGLRVLDGGARAVFSNREVGDYVLFVSVAGQGGQVAHATKIITLLPQPPENPITASSLPDARPQVDVADLVRRWAAEAQGSQAELQVVAETFRQVAGLMRGGVVGTDPLRDVEEAAEIALGTAAGGRWLDTFFIRARDFLAPLNATGNLQTPEQYSNTFENFAAMLEAVAAQQ